MKKVDQINEKNEIIEDFDYSLSRKEIYSILSELIPDLNKERSAYFFDYLDQKYCIYIKNITYLGHPHLIYKKRIQIGNDIKSLYETNNERGIRTLILGIYGYSKDYIFCDFRTEDYIEKKAHNSSAHVNIFDLKKAKQNGEFSRTDYFGNHIHLFTAKNIPEYLSSLNAEDIDNKSKTITTIDDFMNGLDKEWFGIQAYDEMFSSEFPDRKQSEWAGFFLEHMLHEYLKGNPKSGSYIKYRKSKKNDEIDLDLYFPKLDIFGDLKMHSEHSTSILGNDRNVIQKAILENGRIWYLICEHATEKDSEHGFEVTEYWNKLSVKEDLRSYGGKMKYSVNLKKYYILEINKDNLEYLSKFNQGQNSNGKPREPKIMISKKNIDMFLIYSSIFE